MRQPQGRPEGARDRRSNLRYGLLKEVPAILKTLAAAAKDGDIQAAKLILERTLPALKTVAETSPCRGPTPQRARGGLCSGPAPRATISPDEAATLMQAISAQARVVVQCACRSGQDIGRKLGRDATGPVAIV